MCKLAVISQEPLNIEVKLLLSADRMPRRLAQERMSLSNLEWLSHALCATSALAELFVDILIYSRFHSQYCDLFPSPHYSHRAVRIPPFPFSYSILEWRVINIHCVSQKFPPLNSVTLSNINRFSKFLQCWEVYELCYKTIRQYPPRLRQVATLPWEIKNTNSLQIFSIYGEKANKLHFKCTNFNFSTRVLAYSGCIYMFLS